MINKVILRGYVADDPYIRATENGKLARIRIATTERVFIKKSNTYRDHTEWHTVSVWGKYADLIDEKIRVGSAILIEGSLRTNEWEDRDGKRHKTSEVAAKVVELLDTIEGFAPPRPVVERIEKLYPKKRTASPSSEINAPAEDPDNLPF